MTAPRRQIAVFRSAKGWGIFPNSVPSERVLTRDPEPRGRHRRMALPGAHLPLSHAPLTLAAGWRARPGPCPRPHPPWPGPWHGAARRGAVA